MDPATIRLVWAVVAGAAYVALLLIADKRRHSNGWIEHGLAFCLLALLEPFTQKYALVVLLWPALVAGRLVEHAPLKVLIYASIAFVLIQPLVPGAAAQRLLQVLGSTLCCGHAPHNRHGVCIRSHEGTPMLVEFNQTEGFPW